MQPPRMRVALIGTEPDGQALAEALRTAGHSLSRITEPADLAGCEAVIVALDEPDLPGAVDALGLYCRPRLLALHTCSGLGPEALRGLEERGAITASVSNLGGGAWAVSAAEVGAAVVTVVLEECQQKALVVTPRRRSVMVARACYAQMARRLEAWARDGEPTPAPPTGAIIARYAGASEPGFRRSYRELARRIAEIEEREQLELWALQQENR